MLWVSTNLPEDVGPLTVTWATSDTTVAVVSVTGLVRPKRSGSVGVRAKPMNDRTVVAGVATVHIQ